MMLILRSIWIKNVDQFCPRYPIDCRTPFFTIHVTQNKIFMFVNNMQ